MAIAARYSGLKILPGTPSKVMAFASSSPSSVNPCAAKNCVGNLWVAIRSCAIWSKLLNVICGMVWRLIGGAIPILVVVVKFGAEAREFGFEFFHSRGVGRAGIDIVQFAGIFFQVE